jgi:molybdopterin-guanine dinucleotide biosynthesis protein A
MVRQVLALRLNGGIVRSGVESAAAEAASTEVASSSAVNFDKCLASIRPTSGCGLVLGLCNIALLATNVASEPQTIPYCRISEARVNIPATLGLVLSGGRARRMGGGDKARIRIGGKTILERVIATLAAQCSQLIINANGDPNRFADTGLRVVADGVPDYAGPLAGILAGLDWTAGHAPEIEWIVSAPSDCPFLPSDLVARLHRARIEAGAPLACAASAQRPHPVVALWSLSVRQDLRHSLLSEGARKVESWTASRGVAVASWPTTPFDPFFNVNTTEDVAEANHIAARLTKSETK